MLFTLVGGSSEALGQSINVLPPISAVLGNISQSMQPPAQPVVPVRRTLDQLVDQYSEGQPLDAEQRCLATAVYFESMGEPLEGQLAVAQVVINRATSDRYPTSWCGVVKQKAQFSFVRSGRFPRVDTKCEAWRKARAIARIAIANASQALTDDVLWYHADYVAPKWRKNLQRVEKIGAHIFYRA